MSVRYRLPRTSKEAKELRLLRNLNELWLSESRDQRTVHFLNRTGLWVELKGVLKTGQGRSGFTSTTRVKIGPGHQHSWHFLGESMCPDANSPFEVVGLLPDVYSMAMENKFEWSAELLDDVGDAKADGGLVFLPPAKPFLTLQDMVKLEPGQSETVSIGRKRPGSLENLCEAAMMSAVLAPLSSQEVDEQAFQMASKTVEQLRPFLPLLVHRRLQRLLNRISV